VKEEFGVRLRKKQDYADSQAELSGLEGVEGAEYEGCITEDLRSR